MTAQPAGCGYGRRMMDLDQGWRTERLELEPLTVEHAAELAPVLDDAALHEFTGGAPLAPAALTARYARLAERRSPDGHQLWGNWVMRVRETSMAVGTMQVTLPAGGRRLARPRSPGWWACRPKAVATPRRRHPASWPFSGRLDGPS